MTPNRAKNFFGTQQFPYIFTLLIGIMSWGVSHISDRLTGSPIIEYSNSSKQLGDILHEDYNLENITRDKIFDSIDFLIIPSYNESIIGFSYELLPPLQSNSNEDFADTTSTYVKYHVSDLQPYCSLILHVSIKGHEAPAFRLSSKSAILLMASGIETYIAKHETILLLTILMVCILGLGLYIIFSKSVF